MTMVGLSDWISEGGGSLLQHRHRQVSEQRIHATMIMLRNAMYPIVLAERDMVIRSISNPCFQTINVSFFSGVF